MIHGTMNGNSQVSIIDDEPRVRELPPDREPLSEALHGSSPTRRKAAYPSDIGLVGRSQAFTEVMRQVERVSNTDTPLLLIGECGTGKELVAAMIHGQSARADKPFVVVNCATIPAELLESEVFGHMKGSFDRAYSDRGGLWEEADAGTLFLNEITETTPSFQAKLARALQTGEISRLGSSQTQQLNVRVIAGSKRSLDREVSAGEFRNDLFYRLNAVSIVLPPLRERLEDIPSLAQSFADRVYAFSPPVKFSAEALALLKCYSWPGNARELENAVVRAVALCDGTIRVKDLPQRVRNYTQKQPGSADNGAGNGSAREEWVPLSEIEGRYVAQVLEHTRGNKQAAARVLAVDRKTLDRMIKRHHIDSFRRTSR
jgi:DNA-binding NtrC family response regulator